MERRLAAILALDVVGYSRLMGQDEAATLAALKAHRRELVEPEIARHDGRLVSTSGDGALVEFGSVVGAVECAVAIQQGMSERNRDMPLDRRIEFRMGINLDEVIVEGNDILGDGVNVAARLESFAEPGTVCISGSAFAHVKNRLDLHFEDLGEQQFKNIAEPVRTFRIRCAEGGFPYADFATCESLPLPSKPSIAIMPFANLSGDPTQDYLADGLRLDIQAALVKASGLFLIAANTVARYRDAGIPADDAGRQMGVRYVLEGTVRRAGQRIRATMELTDVIARQIVWVEQYDRLLDDGLTVQDEIAAEVLKALDVKLASGERWLLHSTLKSLEALDFFYRGLSRFYAGSKDDNAAAREMFEQVARLQPDSAVGPAYLCFTHWVDAFRGWTNSKERSLTQAARWAETAVSHPNSNNGLAHIVLASIHLLQRRHDQALADCYRAVELRPNCPTANSYLANVLHYCGRPAEAVTKLKEAIRITPVYPAWYMSLLAAAYRESGELPSSITAAKHGIRLNPTDLEPRLVLCSDYVRAGQPPQAREAAREVLAIEPIFSTARYLAGQPYKEEETVRKLERDLREAGLPA